MLRLDAPVWTVPAGWSSGLALHYMHRCYDDRIDSPQLVFANNPDFALVGSRLI
jgi:hypothetical protein